VGSLVKEIITNIFLSTNSQFFGGLTTVQVVDPRPLYRDFPDQSFNNKFKNCVLFIQVKAVVSIIIF
jgi:hypothetical protein